MKLDSPRQRLSQGSVIRTYAGNFSESGFWEKLKSVSRKLGSKVTYMLLVLYYSIGEVPLKDKMLILGVLGYFILPADLVPDLLPGGFADDIAALAAVFRTVRKGVSPMVEIRARSKVNEWFDITPTPPPYHGNTSVTPS